MSRIALIDGDVLVYHSAFAMQKNLYHFEGVTYPSYEDFKTYLKSIDMKPADVEYEKELSLLDEWLFPKVANNIFDMVMEMANPDNSKIVLSGEGNYRQALFPEYKANRKDAAKPVYYDLALKYWTERAWAVTTGIEADDLLGIETIRLKAEGQEPIICSIDKDLNGVPGLHVDWNKSIKYKVSPHQAEVFFLRQLLTGDATDNIKGIKGFGPVKAARFIPLETDIEPAYDAIYSSYLAAYNEDALPKLNLAGQLLHIQRRHGQLWSWDKHKEIYGC